VVVGWGGTAPPSSLALLRVAQATRRRAALNTGLWRSQRGPLHYSDRLLATGIPEALCRKINLGYRDPESIRRDDWRDREAEGYLLVPKSGETLYRLRDDPFAPTGGTV